MFVARISCRHVRLNGFVQSQCIAVFFMDRSIKKSKTANKCGRLSEITMSFPHGTSTSHDVDLN